MEAYLEKKDDIPISIKGDANSLPYGSIKQALSGVTLDAAIPGIGAALITQVRVYIDLVTTPIDNQVSVDFDVTNPLDVDLKITFVQSDSGVNDLIYAHFDWAFNDFVIPVSTTHLTLIFHILTVS